MTTLSRYLLVISALVLVVGCSGTDGANGTDGADGDSCTATDNGDGTHTLDCGGDIIVVSDGTDGTDGTSCTATDNGDGTYTLDCNGTIIVVSDGEDLVSAKEFKNLDFVITQVRNKGGALAVTFTLADNGNPVTSLTMAPVRMMVNQYLVAANAYDSNIWSQDYLYERGSTTGADSRLVQGPPGTYTYTFLETIQEAITNDGANPALSQQIAIRIRGLETYNAVNAIYQFTGLPTAEGAVASPVPAPVGNIVETSACETCHGPRLGNVGHGGGYTKVEYCRNCHTADDPARKANGTDYMTMIHQIHSSYDNTANGGHDFSHVTFPGDMRNCDKCHKGVEGQNWNQKPTRDGCGSCHTDVNFDTGANHIGDIQSDNSGCGIVYCHTPARIKAKHVTENSTRNNPDVPLGASNLTYQINSVTMAGNDATINFAILKDDLAITDLNTTFPPTGFSGSGPGFLFAYALPQDGIDSPADWNNLGNNQAQPTSVSLSSIYTTFVPGAAAGTFDVTVANAFPAEAKMRAVALQGYWTQAATLGPVARHTPSVVKEVTGDSKRRGIVDFSGCLDCHERLELHGGSRVLAAETASGTPPVCIMCHNPNLSSSGNTFDYANFVANPGSYNASTVATVALYGNDPFAWPEATQNFKDLVHGIHGENVRDNPFDHVRIRGGNAYSYDWSHVTFPGDASNCSKCHTGDSYMPDKVPATALMSTNITGTPADRTAALAVRTTVPNTNDEVIRPVVAACYSCHNGALVMAHMNQNGAALGTSRANIGSASPATCVLCHDRGSLADVGERHPGLHP